MDFKLGVVVEQKGIAPTAKNLESLAKASDAAAPAVERLSSSLSSLKGIGLGVFTGRVKEASDAVKEIKDSTRGMAQMAKDIGGLSINLTNIANATDRISGKTKELDSFTASVRQLREELTQMKGVSAALSNIRISSSSGSGGRSGAASVDAEVKAQQRLLAQLERNAMMVGKSKAEYLEARAAQLGITSAAAPYIAKLKEADTVTGKLGMTTKGYNAAMRMIPAQYTDIAVQLAGGQNPMLVLLQQGGQLKDMFGGVGNAAKAVASSIFSFTGVATMAAVAIGGVMYAAYLGSQELVEYKNNVVLTNNAMALSVGNLADMSNAIVASTGATRGSVTELLASMTSNGKVASDMFSTVADAAIRLERAGGQAAEKTVEEFAALGTKPVEAVVKLDEKYHFLTASVYNQIQALQAHGREVEAATVAQKAFADALDTRIPLMEQNLGTLQRMWRAIKDEVIGAWDAAKGFGREKSIKELQDTIEQIESGPVTARLGKRSRLNGLKQQLAILQQQQAVKDRINLNAADKEIQRQEALKKETNAAALRLKYMGDEQKLSKAIEEINKSALSTAEKAAAIKKATDMYGNKPVAGTKNDLSQEYSARISAEKNYAETQIKLVKDRLSQEQISEEKSASDILQVQKVAFEKQKALLEEQLSKTKDVGNRSKIKEQMQEIENQSVLAQSAYTTALAKMAKKNKEYQAGVISSTEKFIKKQEEENEATQLQIDNLGTSAEMQGYNEQAKLKSAAASEYLAAETLRERAMQMLANEENKDAAEFYLELAAAREKAGKAIDEQANLRLEKGMKEQRIEQEKEWKKTSEKISDSITDALMRGFEKGKSFAENLRDTIENMFNTLVLRPIVQATVTGGMSMLGMGGSSSASESTLGSIDNLDSTGSSLWSAYSGGVGSLYGSFATSGVGRALRLSTEQAAGYMAPVYGARGNLISAGTGTAAGGLTDLGSTIGDALPYVGVALAAVTAITSLMKKGGGAKTEGDVYATLSGTGATSLSATDRLGENWITGTNSNTVVENLVTPVGNAVASLITSLGGSAAGIGLNLGFSTDPKGTAQDNIQSGVTNAAGEYVYRSGRNAERGTYATELELETQRMLVAAVKAADVAQVYKDVANSVDLYTASAEELQTVLSNLTAISALRTAFVKMGFNIDDLSTALISAAGGVETLTTNLSSYYENFYSDAEKLATKTKDVSDALSEVGVAMPATKEAFRTIVEGLDLTTTAGQSTFAAMMSVSTAFSEITSAAEAAAKAAKEEQDAVATTLKNAISAAFDAALSFADDAYATLERSISAQKDSLQTSYETQKESYENAISAAQEINSTLTSLSQTLSNAANTTAIESNSRTLLLRQQAQDVLDAAYKAASSGQSLAPFSESITGAIENLSTDSTQLFASYEEYARSQGRANAVIVKLNQSASEQLDTSELTLKTLNNQLDIATKQYNALISDLDLQLSTAQNQLNELKGINTNVLTVAQAMKELSSAISQLTALKPTTTTTSAGAAASASTSAISSLYSSLLGRDVDATGQAYWSGILASGVSITDVAKAIMAGEEYKNSHATGLERVPFDGYKATLHAGEAVVDADSVSAISRYFGADVSRSGGSDEVVVAELKALREDNTRLSAELRAIAGFANKMAKILERITPDGDAISTREAPAL